MTAISAPVAQAERIDAVDAIRGFALFGVLWMNLFAHGSQIAIPGDVLEKLPTAKIDAVTGFISEWLADGKAQCLFSLLFGFGFAVMMDRLTQRGANATGIYLRRLTVLLIAGFAHLFLLWWGDILHAYAMMGFGLLLMRRWPGWLLLSAGLVLCLLGAEALRLWVLAYWPAGQPTPWHVAGDAGLMRRWDIFRAHDYIAYVRELIVSAWSELYGQPVGAVFLSQILGRFMIGAWIYRQGWLQDIDRHIAVFRRGAVILLPLGLVLAALAPVLRLLIETPPPDVKLAMGLTFNLLIPLSQLVLALGYGSLLVLLCRKATVSAFLSGLRATGQMALTNYLAQSLVYMFGLYGFGLGLLPQAGATFCLGVAVAVFAVQMVFSVLWLKAFRFGPAEWLWRSATYGRWQVLRRDARQ